MIAQFVLGFMHHRIYQQTKATTKLAPIHVWLGRVIIPAGIANGFLGFPLALNSKYNWALLALCLLVAIVLGPFAFWKWRRDNGIRKTALARTGDSYGNVGYQSRPWATEGSRSDINLPQMPHSPQPYSPNNYPTQVYPPPHQSPHHLAAEEGTQFV